MTGWLRANVEIKKLANLLLESRCFQPISVSLQNHFALHTCENVLPKFAQDWEEFLEYNFI